MVLEEAEQNSVNFVVSAKVHWHSEKDIQPFRVLRGDTFGAVEAVEPISAVCGDERFGVDKHLSTRASAWLNLLVSLAT